MDKTTLPHNPQNTKPKPKRRRVAIVRNNHNDYKSNRPKKRNQRIQPGGLQKKIWLTIIEIICLSVTAIFAIIMLLGHSASRFSGTSFWNNLLPFAIGILGLIVTASIFLIGWWKLKKWLSLHSEFLSPTLSLVLMLLISWLVTHDQVTLTYGHFRTLVGGKAEAGRRTISHQVYAAYRRHDSAQLPHSCQYYR